MLLRAILGVKTIAHMYARRLLVGATGTVMGYHDGTVG